MKNEVYGSSARDILYGKADGETEEILSLTEDGTARAFLMLEKKTGIPVKPVSDSALARSRDKFTYLSRTQRVRIFRSRLPKNWEQWDLGPFLGLDENGKPYVLLYKNGYRTADPATGELKRLDGKAAGRITESVTIYPAIKDGTSFLPFFRDSLRGFGKELFAFFAAVIAAGLSSALIPECIRYCTDELIPLGKASAVAVFAASAFLAVFSGVCLNIAAGKMKNGIRAKWLNRVYLRLWDRILRACPDAFGPDRASLAGDMYTLFGSLDDLAENVMTVILYGIQCPAAIAIMIAIDPALSVAAAVPLVICTAVQILLIARRRSSAVRLADAQSALIRSRQEILTHIETIKNMGKEERFLYLYALKYDRYHASKLAFSRKKNTSGVLNALFPLLLQIMVYARILLLPGNFSASSVTAFISASSLFSVYSGMLLMSADGLMQDLPVLRYLGRVLRYDTEQDLPDKEYSETSGGTGGIEVNDVSFRYSPDAAYAVRHVSLTVRPGEHIGIVGLSGSGKSTLLRLMTGLSVPDQGEIVYDGKSLFSANLSLIRRRMGIILQDAQLMNGPIWYNISLEKDPDMDKVRRAAEQVGLLRDIEAMPMKFNTPLSNESDLVSGGQKQRILLAQALYRNPSVLFLDEATSALDNESQKKVQDTIDALRITTVVVAHRLSTVRRCSRIFVIDRGSVCEEGTYDELMEKDGLFARMAKRSL